MRTKKENGLVCDPQFNKSVSRLSELNPFTLDGWAEPPAGHGQGSRRITPLDRQKHIESGVPQEKAADLPSFATPNSAKAEPTACTRDTPDRHTYTCPRPV